MTFEMAKHAKPIHPKESETPAGTETLDRLVPRWLPPVLYALVTAILFRKFIFSDEMLWGGDTMALGYAARDFYANALREGAFPLWNPYLLGGTPFLEALSGGDAIYPTSLLPLFMETYRALGWKLILHIFASGLFMFGWIRSLGRSRPAALVAGLAFLMAPFMVAFVHPGHDGKIFVTALTPLLFWTLEWALQRRGWAPFLLFAAEVALVIFTTHFQMAYFLFGALGVYAAFRVIQTARAERSPGVALRLYGLFLGSAVLGAAVAGVQLLPAVDYVASLSRRTATTTAADSPESRLVYSSSWALHPEELLSFIVPEFAGNNAGGAPWAENTYWGRNQTKDNHEYAGVVILFLAGLGLFGANRRALKLFLVSVGLLALLYALGRHTPVWRVFYEIVPGVNYFRVPSISSFLFGFTAITLAAFGVDRIFAWGASGWVREKRVERYLVAAPSLLLFGSLLAASGVLIGFWRSAIYRDLPAQLEATLSAAEPFITRGFFLSALFVGGATGAIWLYRRGLLKASGFLVVVLGLVAFDAGRVDDPFIKTVPFEDWFAPDPNVSYIVGQQTEADPFRVFAAGGRFGFGQDVTPMVHGLELAAGHHPNDLARYRELIGMEGSSIPENLINANVLQILNVRYLIWPDYQFQIPWEDLSRVSGTTIQGRTYEGVYSFPGLDRARLVGRATILPEEETVAYILSPRFDPNSEAVLTGDPGIPLPGEPVQGVVEWVERSPNRLEMTVRSESNALLLVADNWAPAWRASVDGVPTPVLRANHTLRAIPVSPGDHVVVMEYRSDSLRKGLWTSLVGLVLLLAGTVAAGVFRRRASAEARVPESA